jgi:hypothetical protein
MQDHIVGGLGSRETARDVWRNEVQPLFGSAQDATDNRRQELFSG